jgi:23S rRNA U2552 (ribose-2'-O)-methylase RlmE/FtsJ
MTYYLIPKTSFFITKHIDCIYEETPPDIIISNTLAGYLYDLKEKLDKHENEWDIYKKYTNPYEYIHSMVPYKKKSISKCKPLSRSYFKMVEIINTFDLFSEIHKPIKCFHLAEGPGGFIEAFANTRKCKEDAYIGMTLMDSKNDYNIPGWKKSNDFLTKNENVFIETGADNTGNILSVENFIHCRDTYNASMDFITADGGFDFSFDFNKQEVSIAKLLFAQIAYAIMLQSKGGTFILKFFDCFMQHSIDLLYILSAFYDKVYIIKPQTSRYANSEKYLVCRGFLFTSNEKFYPFFLNTFQKMTHMEDNVCIHRFLTAPLSHCFITKIEEINAILGQQQIENIHYTISLIENKHKQEKIDNLIRINIQKCTQWCIRNNIDHHIFNQNSNIFMKEPTNIAEPSTDNDIPSFLELYENDDLSTKIITESSDAF